MSLQSLNPATGETLETYPLTSPESIPSLVDRAHDAHRDYRRSSFTERGKYLRKLAELLGKNQRDHALLMTREMGKPVTQAMGEIEKCARACEFYAEQAEKYLAIEHVETDARESYVAFEPLGVILAIMPWNFPYWQVFRFAVPALMAGNACLLKHASNVPGCSLALQQLFDEAGFPEDLFTSLLIKSRTVDEVIANDKVSAVTLTGSTAAGAAVAASAGKFLKKTVLELGGSDAYLILKDADLELAARLCAQSRMQNAGQSCIAAKRFVVDEAVLPQFEALMVKAMAEYQQGDPEDDNTNLGPLSRTDLRDDLHQQVAESVKRGARCLLGGEIPDGADDGNRGKGAYYPATVLTQVDKSMPAWSEEMFGPVAVIIAARDEEDAINKANDSVFGLGAGVFSRDLERAKQIATYELQAGSCVVNDFVKSDPRLPFGGIKQSGYGRELSYFGIREFVNIKSVVVG
ncbi:MAG: NAD-dependent succinate-semialdehyde dehydrogenase [Pseudohongiellaceae bacterium]